MKRRQLLTCSSLVATSLLAGCLEVSDGGTEADEPATPDELVEEDFQVLTRGEWEDSIPSVDEPPSISFDETASQVTVEGAVSYGASNCNEIQLAEAALDTEANSLEVIALVGEVDTDDDCQSDLTEEQYRVTVVVDNGVPETVEVNEVGPYYHFEETKSSL